MDGIWVAGVSASSALVGALGSQWLAARFGLRVKRLELEYLRKADAYREFVRSAAVLLHDPPSEGKYVPYLQSFLAARLVASPRVEAALNAENGVNRIVQRMRQEALHDKVKMFWTQSAPLDEAMERLVAAMREDLLKVSNAT